MDLGYYPGCSLQQSSSLYDLQNRLIFNNIGINLKEIDDWNCCGATSAGKTDDFLAIAMPARNIGIANAQGLKEMVIPCSACYSRTLVAQNFLKANQEMKTQINSELSKKIDGDLKISSILEVLLSALENGAFAEKFTEKLSLLKPVCYYGCMMTRFPFDVPVPDDVENPQGMEKLLDAAGVHAIDWNYKTACCGASAAVNDPQTAMNLMAKIMKDTVERGANCMIVTCPMCQLNLDAHQDTFCKQNGIDERMPILFITEVLGMAMNLGLEKLQIDRHFIKSEQLFEELEEI
ncbi:CoB--CoM heterodisulfide reductase iron-sulfur subunit B family protein [Desulfobacterales bacterium HSG17]|nr:CoB--CoM heterodisulfide reductase iron-sulfur subunit B family protein [Desulfobacterales bacterium HSG17]